MDGEYKFGISPDADVLIHENWHSFQEESGPAYIYGLHLVRGFEALLVDMGIEANGPGGIVLGSRCGHVRVSPGHHDLQAVRDADPDDVFRLVRAVHGSRLDTIEPGTRFDVGFGIRLEVVRLLGRGHWSDIVLRADFDDGMGIAFTMYGIPIPDHDCIVLTLGCSALRIPIPGDIVMAESLACGKGAEATRRYLTEHPVQEELLNGLSDERPSPTNPTRVGVWYRGDEREYPFPDEFDSYELWWGTPLRFMSPDNLVGFAAMSHESRQQRGGQRGLLQPLLLLGRSGDGGVAVGMLEAELPVQAHGVRSHMVQASVQEHVDEPGSVAQGDHAHDGAVRAVGQEVEWRCFR